MMKLNYVITAQSPYMLPVNIILLLMNSYETYPTYSHYSVSLFIPNNGIDFVKKVESFFYYAVQEFFIKFLDIGPRLLHRVSRDEN